MNKLLVLFTGLLFLSATTWAAGGDYKLTKISPAVIRTPDFNYNGDQRRIPGPAGQWLEIEVQFQSNVDFTDELTFKYYVLFAGTLLTGEVNHISIIKGRELHSVMYVTPHTLVKLLDGKQLSAVAIGNVAVQILNKGQLIDEMSWKPAQGQWWQTMQQTTGLLINKNETPFAPLYWDRYEAIKAPTH
jgi:hypothetical protein